MLLLIFLLFPVPCPLFPIPWFSRVSVVDFTLRFVTFFLPFVKIAFSPSCLTDETLPVSKQTIQYGEQQA